MQNTRVERWVRLIGTTQVGPRTACGPNALISLRPFESHRPKLFATFIYTLGQDEKKYILSRGKNDMLMLFDPISHLHVPLPVGKSIFFPCAFCPELPLNNDFSLTNEGKDIIRIRGINKKGVFVKLEVPRVADDTEVHEALVGLSEVTEEAKNNIEYFKSIMPKPSGRKYIDLSGWKAGTEMYHGKDGEGKPFTAKVLPTRLSCRCKALGTGESFSEKEEYFIGYFGYVMDGSSGMYLNMMEWLVPHENERFIIPPVEIQKGMSDTALGFNEWLKTIG